MIKKMAEILKDLNAKKAKEDNDVPINLTQENIELFSSFLSRLLNLNIGKTMFPNNLSRRT